MQRVELSYANTVKAGRPGLTVSVKFYLLVPIVVSILWIEWSPFSVGLPESISA